MSDASLAALATRLIKKRGRLVDFVHREKTDGVNPRKPWKPGVPEDNPERLKAAFIDFEVGRIDGSRILSGDKRCFISAQDMKKGEPDENDVIVDDDPDNPWTIVNITILQPGVLRLVYDVHVRKP